MTRWIVALLLVLTLSLATQAAESININTAEAATIARELKGIGMSRARAIVEWRRQNGRFESLADLLAVKGVGPKVLELNRGVIRFRDSVEEP
ncbi:MAG: helix-hairpin-helix domain-containing protein [Gammaproteobacteria bacterium]|nr:helix-hairpin-helix domain-containing protein [Gammaproteobacteria bacterium]